MSAFTKLLSENRNYRYTWTGQVVSEIGDHFNNIAVFALVMEKGGSGLVVSGVMLSRAIPAVLAREAWLSIAFVSVAMLGYTGSLANMLTFPADAFPGNAVASVFGLASMGAGFGGMVFTLITGWVVDHYSYTPAFIGFGILPLVCATILWVFLGPLRPQKLA